VWWTTERDPKPRIEVDGHDAAAIASAVHEHTTRESTRDSWVQRRIDHEGRPSAAFSPRLKTPSSRQAWNTLQSARHQTIDALPPTTAALDLRMIGALGEPAYWRIDRTPRPDEGASRWEMKTRNRGEEFVGDRLAPLSHAVAARSTEEILAGLTGRSLRDEVGKNKPDSRTGTGLCPPGPVDNAVAWCALWGISQFPVIAHVGRQSTTACTDVPGRRTHPTHVYLPMPARPITLARLRTLLASHDLRIAGTTPAQTGGTDAIDTTAARTRLVNNGVRALIRFPVSVSTNPSAPERMVLDGAPVPIGRGEATRWP
jgi:CRISPR-associated protein Csb3